MAIISLFLSLFLFLLTTLYVPPGTCTCTAGYVGEDCRFVVYLAIGYPFYSPPHAYTGQNVHGEVLALDANIRAIASKKIPSLATLRQVYCLCMFAFTTGLFVCQDIAF